MAKPYNLEGRKEVINILNQLRNGTSAIYFVRSTYFGSKEELFDMAVEYYQGGAVYEFSEDAIRPFVTFSGGVTRWAPKSTAVGSEWQFSFTGGGGIKAFVSPNIGFRIEGRLLIPFWGGASFFCGFPAGCWTGLGGYVTTIQGNVLGGLIVAF